MAKQESLVKMRGKVGDLSFSKHRSRGYEVRMKGGVDKSRIASDPNFQRTRENNAEFGSANKMAKSLRLQLNNLLRYFSDKSMRNRLTSLVHRIQKADPVNLRGERVFLPENADMLKGFELNIGSSLKMILAEDLEPVIDRDAETVSLVIPQFNPQNDVTLLNGATHMQVVLVAAELTMQEVPPKPVVERSAYIPLIGEHVEETLQLTTAFDPGSAAYVLVGIGLFQEVNGAFYPLNNGSYNAMSIVEVDIP
ncbi:hypothetical protein FAZ19_21730 [Sphingobacterium alkalisoli]|nr:hypothetical protein [Sphingobacterium alkalisoli]TJY61519.1 hypothetical protein FAZ19_21730 [Sphingobacterium alkalisoli]GGH29877.1 hypothetical protein GCM10011418_41520 [Sphingobacterium alkalisoli]